MSRKQKKVRVKTAKRRKTSSTRWLQRQLNDEYVQEAKRLGYRSRAAFKIIQLDEKLGLFKPGMRVVDLGAAPGGWSQVVADIVQSQDGKVDKQGKVVAIDYLDMEPLPGVDFMKKDFTEDDAPDMLKNMLDGPADVVMSDMAAPTTGHKQTDHLRIMALAEMGYDFARDVLVPGGTYLAKLFQGGADKDLLDLLKAEFDQVRHVKPKASRSDSSELYIVATGFKGKSDAYPDMDA